MFKNHKIVVPLEMEGQIKDSNQFYTVFCITVRCKRSCCCVNAPQMCPPCLSTKCHSSVYGLS